MPDVPCFCPECGAPWPARVSFQDYFLQLFALEWEYSLLEVHHPHNLPPTAGGPPV